MRTGHRLLGNPVGTDGDAEHELQRPGLPSVSRPVHNFINATLDTPDWTGRASHGVLPCSGDKAAKKLEDIAPISCLHPRITPMVMPLWLGGQPIRRLDAAIRGLWRDLLGWGGAQKPQAPGCQQENEGLLELNAFPHQDIPRPHSGRLPESRARRILLCTAPSVPRAMAARSRRTLSGTGPGERHPSRGGNGVSLPFFLLGGNWYSAQHTGGPQREVLG